MSVSQCRHHRQMVAMMMVMQTMLILMVRVWILVISCWVLLFEAVCVCLCAYVRACVRACVCESPLSLMISVVSNSFSSYEDNTASSCALVSCLCCVATADDIPRIADLSEKADEDLTLQVADAPNQQVRR